MEIDEDMALLVVKEQFTHFKIKKGIEEECKDHLHGGEPTRYIIHMLAL